AAAGRFRDDLYYRLSVYTISLPPLRERGDDLPRLVEHFVRRFSRELGKDVHQVAPGTLEILRRHPWPGNLRELQSVLKQVLLHATGRVLRRDFLPASVLSEGRREEGGGMKKDGPAPAPPSALLPPPCGGAALPDLERFVSGRFQAGSQDLYAES